MALRRPQTGPRLVWQQTPHGWRAVRVVVPPRSERVPRPPEHRGTVAGVEDAPTLRDEVHQLAELRGVVDVATEIVGAVSARIGQGPTVLLAALLLSRRTKGKRR